MHKICLELELQMLLQTHIARIKRQEKSKETRGGKDRKWAGMTAEENQYFAGKQVG